MKIPELEQDTAIKGYVSKDVAIACVHEYRYRQASQIALEIYRWAKCTQKEIKDSLDFLDQKYSRCGFFIHIFYASTFSDIRRKLTLVEGLIISLRKVVIIGGCPQQEQFWLDQLINTNWDLKSSLELL